MWVFPYYMETYIINVMPEMEMIDYKINYTNHDLYHNGENGRKQGSPVRIFTNILLRFVSSLNCFYNANNNCFFTFNFYSKIPLPQTEGYKYCTKCQRWVAKENRHCSICVKCPSKNGDTYVHCNLCKLCVKPNYKHCKSCGRCTQKVGHDCLVYQRNLICWICRQKGHTERKCENWRGKITKGNKLHCLICGVGKHNEKFCPKRRVLLGEEYFLGEYIIEMFK